MTKHLSNIQVERLHAVALLEREVGIAGSLTDHVQRGTLTFGNLTDVLNVFLVDKQTHALLTLVGNDFLRRKRLVANRQLGHVNLATTLLNELRQAVQVTGRTVVMDRDHRRCPLLL